MQNDALPLQVTRLASKTFAGDKGFSGPEIMDFFRQYVDDIPDYWELDVVPSRWVLFEDCLKRFPTGKQRDILLELCSWEGPMKWGRPEPSAIATLRRLVLEGVPVDEFPSKLTEIDAQTVREKMWDVFICHASEDKEAVARPLANALSEKGLEVWYDEFTLTLGDSLRRSINHGLAQSRYGVVILSPDFFAKEWPQQELDGLAALEVDGEKKILPVWHNVTREDVARFSPILADKFAVSTAKGIDTVVAEILRVARPGVDPGAEAVPSREEPALTNGPWLYEFIDYFNEAQKRYPPLPGSEIAVHPEATCDQQSMRAIFEHPPADGNESSTLIYNLMVPPGTSPLKLAGFIGILTERPSPGGTTISERNLNNSVLFEILINGKSGYRKQKYTSKWEEFSISVSRSESLNICFRTNCLGNNEWNWAAWGEPRLVEAKPTSSAERAWQIEYRGSREVSIRDIWEGRFLVVWDDGREQQVKVELSEELVTNIESKWPDIDADPESLIRTLGAKKIDTQLRQQGQVEKVVRLYSKQYPGYPGRPDA